jgi:hypothetical protein
VLKRFKKLWKSIDDFQVYLVDGAQIRRDQEIDYTQGGHHLRWDFIPENEFWIEKMLDSSEQPFNYLHEITEFVDMRDNGTEYDKSHDKAKVIETKARKNPKLSEGLIKIAEQRLTNNTGDRNET